MNTIDIDFNQLFVEIFTLFKQLLVKIVIIYTDRSQNTFTTTFVNLFISVILLDKILSIFFAKYNDYDHNDMDTDDLYDE